jgi:hypothetical protein
MPNTPEYSISLPDVGGSSDAWGTILNNAIIEIEKYLSGIETQDGSVIINANITATTANLSGTVTITDATITAASVSTDSLTLTGDVKELVGTLAGTTPAISPDNGTIQKWNVTAESDPTFASWDDGQSVTLRISTAGNTINWPAVDWIGGGIPVLESVGENWLTIWRVDGVYYGIYSGAST